MLSNAAIEAILGIQEQTVLEPKEMAKRLTVVFYNPTEAKPSHNIVNALGRLEGALVKLGVKVMKYDDALVRVPAKKRLKKALLICGNNIQYACKFLLGRIDVFDHYISLKTALLVIAPIKIRNGVTIITSAPIPTEYLPINVVSSFKNTSIISVVDRPAHITKKTPFKEHFDTAMALFAEHMSNIVLLVDEKECTLYNFNASHPTFALDESFETSILSALIPKVYAPIRPLRFKDINIDTNMFEPFDEKHKTHTEDFIAAGTLFEQTSLYPEGKSISSLPFRTDFHRWIGKLHLDHRTGMSYGFLAKQLPQEIPQVVSRVEFEKIHGKISDTNDYFFLNNELFILVTVLEAPYVIKVPRVDVLSLRSGSKKTAITPEKDFVMLSLRNGKIFLQAPRGLKIHSAYKPSFDTSVILAHAVGSAILAAIVNHVNPSHSFVETLRTEGQGIVHWHGYINKEILSDEWMIYGGANPHVACSSPQSAVFALKGKLAHIDSIDNNSWSLKNTLHIEPHHGSNATFTTLTEASTFLKNAGTNVSLGNNYLEHYTL